MYKNKLLQAASWWNKLFLLIIPHKYENIDIKILEVKLPKGWMKQIEQLKLLHVLLNVSLQYTCMFCMYLLCMRWVYFTDFTEILWDTGNDY